MLSFLALATALVGLTAWLVKAPGFVLKVAAVMFLLAVFVVSVAVFIGLGVLASQGSITGGKNIMLFCLAGFAGSGLGLVRLLHPGYQS